MLYEVYSLSLSFTLTHIHTHNFSFFVSFPLSLSLSHTRHTHTYATSLRANRKHSALIALENVVKRIHQKCLISQRLYLDSPLRSCNNNNNNNNHTHQQSNDKDNKDNKDDNKKEHKGQDRPPLNKQSSSVTLLHSLSQQVPHHTEMGRLSTLPGFVLVMRSILCRTVCVVVGNSSNTAFEHVLSLFEHVWRYFLPYLKVVIIIVYLL